MRRLLTAVPFLCILFTGCMTPAVKGEFAERPVKRLPDSLFSKPAAVSDVIPQEVPPAPSAIEMPLSPAVADSPFTTSGAAANVADVRVSRNTVKVLLATGVKNESITLSGKFVIRSEDESVECKEERYTVSLNGGRANIKEADEKFDLPVVFEPFDENGRFTINGNSYRGKLLFTVNKNGASIAVNEVSIEDYLKGVLPYEIGTRDSSYFEALKVQAIIARTYTYSRLDNQRTDGFDVYSDQNDQVYKGTEKEYLLANAAVDATADMVVSCRDSLIQSFYFSTSPGRTANIEEMWPDRGVRTYLRSVPDSEFNTTSPHFRWEESWTRHQLEKILHKTIPSVLKGSGSGSLEDISIAETAECGRVKVVRIEIGGRTYEVKGDKVRWILTRESAPGQILKSAFFTLDIKRH
ncbi:MAG: SpoIID/LytB domain-containing protein, partial [Fibrobacteres bacterium]|nr:SpoIID/LytB domain-containing protein [Fibrobacterota bacterium]